MVKGSSASEKATKAFAKMNKRAIREKRNSKRKKSGANIGEQDSSDYSDDENVITPAQRRKLENGANPMAPGYKKHKKDEKKEKLKNKREDHVAGGHKITEDSLPIADFSNLVSFKSVFWTGAPGETDPSDELKESRKAIGVNVRGNLHLCPPPVGSASADGLPSCFEDVFTNQNLKTPSAIQQQCWPTILAGANVLGLAPTGSGKTLAYGLPMIPHILAHIDAASKALKGSNYTAPLKIHTEKPAPIALVLVPTRELATQVSRAFKVLNRMYSIRSVAVYGGKDKETQIEELNSNGGAHIIVATPGRLLDLIGGRTISLKKVSYLVIDEADRMLMMGFFEQLQAISNQVRPDRQALMFSATFPGKLRDAANDWIGQAVYIRCSTFEVGNGHEKNSAERDDSAVAARSKEVSASTTVANEKNGVEETNKNSDNKKRKAVGMEKSSDEQEQEQSQETVATTKQPSFTTSSLSISETVTQEVHVCATHKKPRLLIKFIERRREQEKLEKRRQPGNMIIFCTKIKTLKFVHDFLLRHGTKGTVIIHGQMPQSMRERALNDFKSGKCSILLATDVAARGLHIKKLQHVVNYDFPSNLEQYCHRVGRTGRQGESGHAYSLITRNMAPMVDDLIGLLKKCKQEPIEPNLLALNAEFKAGGFQCAAESDGDDEEES